jgi:hypothetical protein
MLIEHLDERRAEGVRMNVNLLGEAILSEEEAAAAAEGYLDALQRPEIEVVSRQDLDDLLADLAAGPPAHGRRAGDRMERCTGPRCEGCFAARRDAWSPSWSTWTWKSTATWS